MIQRPPACQRHADALPGKALIVEPRECPWCWAEERDLEPAEGLDVLARKIADRMALSYSLSSTRAADVAEACDETIDQTGNLLGWLREYARLQQQSEPAMRGEQE